MGLRSSLASLGLALLTSTGWTETTYDNCENAAALTLDSLRSVASQDLALPSSRIAIIIDDLGYHLKRGELAANLPGSVSLAILPHSPFGSRLAALAEVQHKEVLLHAPMSSLSGRALDTGGLTEAMDQITFLRILRDNLRAIPQARGLNNHMGSLLTQQAPQMQWLMTELRERRLFFVDSRTTHLSVAFDTALNAGVPSAKRDYFLDNQRDCHKIARQFERMVSAARQRGQSLAIAHPYPETLSLLSALLPGLAEAGINLVPVSELVQEPKPTQSAKEKQHSQSF